jgi:hypothetical protein
MFRSELSFTALEAMCPTAFEVSKKSIKYVLVQTIDCSMIVPAQNLSCLFIVQQNTPGLSSFNRCGGGFFQVPYDCIVFLPFFV